MNYFNIYWIMMMISNILLSSTDQLSEEEVSNSDLIPNVENMPGFRKNIEFTVYPKPLFITRNDSAIHQLYISMAIRKQKGDCSQLGDECMKIMQEYKEDACLRVFYFFSETYEEIMSIVRKILNQVDTEASSFENQALTLTPKDLIDYNIDFIGIIVAVTDLLVGIEVFLKEWATEENSFCFRMFKKYEDILKCLYGWLFDDENLYVLKEKLFISNVTYYYDNDVKVYDRVENLKVLSDKSKQIFYKVEFSVVNQRRHYEIEIKKEERIEASVEKINNLYSKMSELNEEIKKHKMESVNDVSKPDFIQELFDSIHRHQLDVEVKNELIRNIKGNYFSHANYGARYLLTCLYSKWDVYGCLNDEKKIYAKQNFIRDLRAIREYEIQLPEVRYISEDMNSKIKDAILTVKKDLLRKMSNSAITQIKDFYKYNKGGESCFLDNKEIIDPREYILAGLLSDEPRVIYECLDMNMLWIDQIWHVLDANASLTNIIIRD